MTLANLAKPFDQQFCRVTKIGNEAESALAGVKREADRIDRVVRNGKRLHGDVADREFRAGTEDAPVTMLA